MVDPQKSPVSEINLSDDEDEATSIQDVGPELQRAKSDGSVNSNDRSAPLLLATMANFDDTDPENHSLAPPDVADLSHTLSHTQGNNHGSNPLSHEQNPASEVDKSDFAWDRLNDADINDLTELLPELLQQPEPQQSDAASANPVSTSNDTAPSLSHEQSPPSEVDKSGFAWDSLDDADFDGFFKELDKLATPPSHDALSLSQQPEQFGDQLASHKTTVAEERQTSQTFADVPQQSGGASANPVSPPSDTVPLQNATRFKPLSLSKQKAPARNKTPTEQDSSGANTKPKGKRKANALTDAEKAARKKEADIHKRERQKFLRQQRRDAAKAQNEGKQLTPEQAKHAQNHNLMRKKQKNYDIRRGHSSASSAAVTPSQTTNPQSGAQQPSATHHSGSNKLVEEANRWATQAQSSIIRPPQSNVNSPQDSSQNQDSGREQDEKRQERERGRGRGGHGL